MDRLSIRFRSDIGLKIEIRRVFEQNFLLYGVRTFVRSGGNCSVKASTSPRCSIVRLMRSMTLRGIIREKPIRPTFSDKMAPSQLDPVNRQFKAPAPNRLRVSDFTYVATWQGFAYLAMQQTLRICADFLKVFARRFVEWRASRTVHADFSLYVLEQAPHDRRPARGGGLVHHWDRSVQHVSIRYSEQLAEAAPWTG